MRPFLLLFIAAAGLFWGCSGAGEAPPAFTLQGAWRLTQIDYIYDHTERYAPGQPTFLRVYQGDTVLYESVYTQSASALTIYPKSKLAVTLIDKGHGQYVYMEDGEPRPLTVKDDSTIVIQRHGHLYTWQCEPTIGKEWGEEICATCAGCLQEGDGRPHGYVLSTTERRQAGYISWLLALLGVAAAFIAVIVKMYLSKLELSRRLGRQLEQIKTDHHERPAPVRRAIETMEDEFFASSYYQSLQRRMATGQMLKQEEWQEVEQQINKVYPGFCRQLHNLHAMSELEYEVCLLIKLRVSPKDMAQVLARDVSTISTVRSRLYKKVFGQKGGARDWDEFILSINA